MLTRIVYVSELDPTTTDVQFHALAAAARLRARRFDATGMLVRGPCHVAQVLEGRAEALASVMAWVGEDPCQREVQIVACAPIERRRYADWCVAAVRGYEVGRDLAELHRTGRLRELGLDAILDRLTLTGVDEPMLRMLVDAPHVAGSRVERIDRGPAVSRRRA